MSDAIVLPPRLDAAALKWLLDDLVTASRNGDVRLDAGGVTHMGALGAQMILATARSARTNGGTLQFVQISARGRDQLAAMGLSPETISEGRV